MNYNEATRRFVNQHLDDDVRQLALQYSAHRSSSSDKGEGGGDGDVELPFALDQIRGRQIARRKLPTWAAIDDILYPPHLSMEQCSSEQTARYKASIVERLVNNSLPTGEGRGGASLPTGATGVFRAATDVAAAPQRGANPHSRRRATWGGASFADLTGGFGVDFAFMAQAFHATLSIQSPAKSFYVERNPQLCDLAQHNFPLLGLRNTEVVCSTTEDFLNTLCTNKKASPTGGGLEGAEASPTGGGLEGAEASPTGRGLEGATIIYLDPARRDDHGGRTYGIADCTPNVLELRDTLLAKADYILLKLSPMLDWRKAVSDLGEDYVCEVHIVSVHNECKELLIVLQKPNNNVLEQKHKTLFCINDQQLFTISSPSLLGRLGSLEQPPMWLRPHKGERIPHSFSAIATKAAKPSARRREVGAELPCQLDSSSGVLSPSLLGRSGGALYEPNASIMKVGCFHELCEQFGLAAVGPNSHLFVRNPDIVEPPSKSADKDFPGRVFQISAISSMNKRSLRQNLQGITQANISTRNFPLKPEELRRRLKLRDGGDTYLFGTTLSDGSHVILICKKWEDR